MALYHLFYQRDDEFIGPLHCQSPMISTLWILLAPNVRTIQSRCGKATASSRDCDLPLRIHPLAIRASAINTPCGAGGATGRSAEPSRSAARRPVAERLAAYAAGVL